MLENRDNRSEITVERLNKAYSVHIKSAIDYVKDKLNQKELFVCVGRWGGITCKYLDKQGVNVHFTNIKKGNIVKLKNNKEYILLDTAQLWDQILNHANFSPSQLYFYEEPVPDYEAPAPTLQFHWHNSKEFRLFLAILLAASIAVMILVLSSSALLVTIECASAVFVAALVLALGTGFGLLYSSIAPNSPKVSDQSMFCDSEGISSANDALAKNAMLGFGGIFHPV